MEILDCTLRDGGYYTDWDFDAGLVSLYLEAMNKLPVQYVELGYRNMPQGIYKGKYYYSPFSLLKEVRGVLNKKLAVMLDEKSVTVNDADRLLQDGKGIVDLVRIATTPTGFINALTIGKHLNGMGFEIAYNVMYLSRWKEYPELFSQLNKLKRGSGYIYLVDSYGGTMPGYLKEVIRRVREETDCKIGFHGHNNLELALFNTLTAIECGIDVVDVTVSGMGRGAGNLKTELLLTILNNIQNLSVDFNVLADVTKAFNQLKGIYGWGTNLPYMLSGINSLPQKDVMYWTTQRYYSMNSIVQALDNRRNGLDDNVKLQSFSPKTETEQIIIVGGGSNVEFHSSGISDLISTLGDVSIVHASSKNAIYFKDISNPQYFCLVGNEGYRLEKSFNNWRDFKGECILPPYPREMGTYIPESLKENSYELLAIDFTDLLSDSHTVLALQTAILLKAKKIYLIGYDGYRQSMISQIELNLMHENEVLFKHFQDHTGIPLISLTPTNYKNLHSNSIYNLIK